MKTLSPHDAVTQAVTQFVNAMNKGDVETMLRLYEPGASLVVQPGVVATGTERAYVYASKNKDDQSL